MGFTRMPNFSKNIADLPDEPNSIYSTAEVKALFDVHGNELRAFLNNFLAFLESQNGAENIGIKAISGVASISVQSALENLKNYVDTKILGFASSSHNHDTVYSLINHNHSGVYAPNSHSHDSSYLGLYSTAANSLKVNGKNVFVQSSQPTPQAVGDIWIVS